MEQFIAVFPLLTGWILDRCLGDPLWLPHPVVGFGRMIHYLETRFNRGGHRVLKGAFTAVGLTLSVYLLVWFGLDALSFSIFIKLLVEAILIFYCLAGKTLVNEVRMVFLSLYESLEKGRNQVSRIVGRDTSQLSENEIKTAALETLAENLSDGVIAPLFWYLILGVPGMVAYKMVNTLDSMIGYKNEKFIDFGRWGAKIDDLANYIPARLTAFLMLVVSNRLNLLGFVRRFGRQHLSPNSGYPEAALAGILDCRFGGTHNYFGKRVYKPYIGINERRLTFDDMLTSVVISRRAEILMVIIVLLIRTLYSF